MFASFDHRRDAQRVTQWMRDHGRAVRGYLFALVRRLDLADDLTQDVFRKAWQARGSYQEQGTPLAYLLRIADRVACDWSRRVRPELNLDGNDWRRFEPAAEESDAEHGLHHAEAVDELMAALDQLSAVQRRVLLLRYYGDLSFTEIATVLNCPLNTALSHCRRALSTLRKMLAGKFESPL